MTRWLILFFRDIILRLICLVMFPVSLMMTCIKWYNFRKVQGLISAERLFLCLCLQAPEALCFWVVCPYIWSPKYPLSTCTWVCWSIWPTMTFFWPVSTSVRSGFRACWCILTTFRTDLILVMLCWFSSLWCPLDLVKLVIECVVYYDSVHGEIALLIFIFLTLWPLGDVIVILKYNLWTHHGPIPWTLLVKLHSGECQTTPLMMSQHWFRWWIGAVRQGAITWANVDPDICHHMASVGHFFQNVILFF